MPTNQYDLIVSSMYPIVDSNQINTNADRVLHGPTVDWRYTDSPSFSKWRMPTDSYNLQIWPIPDYGQGAASLVPWALIWEGAGDTPWATAYTANISNRRVYAETRNWNVFAYFSDTQRWESLIPINSSQVSANLSLLPPYPDDPDNQRFIDNNNKNLGASPWNESGITDFSQTFCYYAQSASAVITSRLELIQAITVGYEAKLSLFPGRDGTQQDIENSNYIASAGIDPYPYFTSAWGNDPVAAKLALSSTYYSPYGATGYETLMTGRWQRLTGNWQLISAFAAPGPESAAGVWMSQHPNAFYVNLPITPAPTPSPTPTPAPLPTPVPTPPPVVIPPPIPGASGFLILPASSVFERQSFDIELRTTGVVNGTDLTYVISGIESSRLTIPNTGTIKINNGVGILSILVNVNTIGNDNNLLRISIPQLGISGEVYINDSSAPSPTTAPTPGPGPDSGSNPFVEEIHVGIFSSGTIITNQGYNSIQSKIRELLGPGASGYGVAAMLSQPATTGTVVTAQQWGNLITDISTVLEHQTNVPVPQRFLINAGDIISANKLNYFSTTTDYVTSDNQKYTVHPQQLSPPIVASSSTRDLAFTWDGSISHIVVASWPSTQIASNFFNLGGAIRIDAGHLNNGVTADDAAWAALIDAATPYVYDRTKFIGPSEITEVIATGQAELNSIRYVINTKRTINTANGSIQLRFEILFINDVVELLVAPQTAVWDVTGPIIEI